MDDEALLARAEAALTEILSPEHFVTVRKTHGGPAPSETLRAIGMSEKALGVDESWLRETRGKVRRAEEQLKQVSAEL